MRSVVRDVTGCTQSTKMASSSEQRQYYLSDSPVKKRPKSKGNGRYCVVANCNSRQADGYTMHSFPKDPGLAKKWINFVQVCRADFGPVYGTPTKSSAVCHLHFAKTCYPDSFYMQTKMGLNPKRDLVSGSVPNIQAPVKTATATASCTTTTVTTTKPSCVTTTSHSDASISRPICSVKIGGAYRKRERQRVSYFFLLRVWYIVQNTEMSVLFYVHLHSSSEVTLTVHKLTLAHANM